MKKFLLLIFIVTGLQAQAQNNAWFSFVQAHDVDLELQGFIPSYPDSNLYAQDGTPLQVHVLGVSFDPVSAWFSAAWANQNMNQLPFVVTELDGLTFLFSREKERRPSA